VIKQAALRFRGEIWTLPRPARHHHILHALNAVLGWSPATRRVEPLPDGERIEQGFVYDWGAFCSREDAALHAFLMKQIPERKRELFSEDLW